MRNFVVIAAVSAASALLLAIPACGSATSFTDPVDPGTSSGTSGPGTSGLPGTSGGTSGTSGGTSGTSGGDPDAGDAGGDGGTPGPKSTVLKAGNLILIGVTTDATPHAVYINIAAASASLEAIPVAGGAAVVLDANFAQTDIAIVRGGVAAWYTAVDATTNVGTINLWSKAAGVKAAVATKSVAGIFTASKDGTRVAYGLNATPATPTATPIAVADMATVSSATTANLTGANALNLAAAAADCAPDIAFEGNVFFGAYCTGTSATAKNARLVTVAAAATTASALITNVGTTGIQPFWQPDTTADKLFVIGLATDATPNQGKIVTVGGATALLEGATDDGFMLNDGSAAIYKTATTLKRATAVAVPVITTLTTGVDSIIDTSADGKHLLFSKLAADATTGAVDIESIDTTTANQTATAIVATGTSIPVGFSADSANVVYLTDLATAGGANVKSKPAIGGTEKLLAAASVGAAVPPTGTGLVLLGNPVKDANMITRVDLRHVDIVKAGAPAAIAAAVPDDSFVFSGTKLVYLLDGASGAGLYTVDIP